MASRKLGPKSPLLMALCLAIVAAIGVWWSHPPGATAKPSMTASWARTYDSLHDLTAEADRIVLARVDSTEATLDPPDHPPFTQFKLRIESTLKGAPANSLIVSQIGGSGAEMLEDPLMLPGEQYVFFLKGGEALYYGAPHKAIAVLGGPMGRFSVRGGRVFSMNGVHSEAKGLGPIVDNVPLHEFIDQVASLVGK